MPNFIPFLPLAEKFSWMSVAAFFVAKFPQEFKISPMRALFCRLCEEEVVSISKYKVQRHRSSQNTPAA
jgi:hypothetical protein